MYLLSAERHRFKQIYEQEIKHGSIDLEIDKIVMFGVAGSGKTCTLHVLLGKPPPDIRCSSPLMERPITVLVISVDDQLHWQEMTPQQIRQRIAEIIRSRSEALSQAAKSSPCSDHEQQYSTTASQPHPPTKEGSSGASTLQSESPDPLLESLSEEYVSLINASAPSSEPILHQNWLYVIDSGGQHEFHEVLPIFLNGASDFIFVFRVHDELEERPKIAFYDSGDKLHEYPSFLTNEEIFKQCMHTMRSFTSKNKDNTPPQVLLLGTHQDKVKEEDLPILLESLNERLKKTLLPHFRDQVIFCDETLKNCVFTINAQQPERRDRECAEAVRRILCKKDERRCVKMPLRWHALEQALQKMSQDRGSKVLSKHECLEIAKPLHIDDESCEKALKFFSDLNLLFYWPSILPDLVFVEPQVILDKVSELVKESYKVRRGRNSQQLRPTRGNFERRMFRDYGQVTEKFMERFNKHYIPPLFTPSKLITLFKGLLVFARLSSGVWFMPSLLEVVSEDVAQYRVSQDAALAIHFPDDWPQVGLFCCMVAFLLSPDNTYMYKGTPCPWKVLEDELGKPKCLARNVIKFEVKCFPGYVTIIDYFTHFEVHVKTPVEERELWQLVQHSVVEGLNKASKILGYTDNTFELAIVCPAHPSTPHPATINYMGMWICSKNKEEWGEVSPQSIPWWRDSSAGGKNHYIWFMFSYSPTLTHLIITPCISSLSYACEPEARPLGWLALNITPYVLFSCHLANLWYVITHLLCTMCIWTYRILVIITVLPATTALCVFSPSMQSPLVNRPPVVMRYRYLSAAYWVRTSVKERYAEDVCVCVCVCLWVFSLYVCPLLPQRRSACTVRSKGGAKERNTFLPIFTGQRRMGWKEREG